MVKIMEAELTSYFGLNIYTDTGIYIGIVIDLILDLDTKSIKSLVVNNINKNLFENNIKGILIPYRWVVIMKDIVLIRDVIFKKIKQKSK